MSFHIKFHLIRSYLFSILTNSNNSVLFIIENHKILFKYGMTQLMSMQYCSTDIIIILLMCLLHPLLGSDFRC